MERILSTTLLWSWKRMKLESCTVDLANGNIVDFERAGFHGQGIGIMILPITDDDSIILIEHFCIGSEQSEIMLPWGYRDPGYSLEDIANKELQEETGYKSQNISYLTELHILPGYLQAKSIVCIAQDLIPSRVDTGDEFETITLHQMSRDDIMQAIADNRINDCRTIAALMYYKSKR